MQPLFNKLFIIPIIEEPKNTSGLVTPSHYVKGSVLFTGTGLPDRKMTVKKGDIVLHEPGIGTPYTHEGQQGLFIREEEITSIL